MEENDHVGVPGTVSRIQISVKGRSVQKSGDISENNLKFQLEIKSRIGKHPSGCCGPSSIRPSCPVALGAAAAAVLGSGRRQDCLPLAPLSGTFRTTTSGQLLCSACRSQSSCVPFDLFLLNWILLFFSPLGRLTTFKGSSCH